MPFVLAYSSVTKQIDITLAGPPGGWIRLDNDKEGNLVSSSLFTERIEDNEN
jgi:hypothetical protein